MINHGDFIRVDDGMDTGKIGQVVSVSDKFVTANIGKIKTFSIYSVHKVEIKTIIMLLNERGIS